LKLTSTKISVAFNISNVAPYSCASIKVEELFQDIAKAADPAKIAEQLRRANEQLEITRHYPGRTPPQMTGKFDCQQS
jgi:hypothetical protein